MADKQIALWDGNEAIADVAFRVNEVISIYPITPASPMGEHADAWAAKSMKNVWGNVPDVVEMQSEGGAAGAVHGALQAGALTTTFTASQGLLLMIPNMYKIAGELTSSVIHVAARSIAGHALSIFADHSDVYAARQTGYAILASSSVQEAHDMAAIAHAATLTSRLPFLHFMDGFRTSHEISKTERISDEILRELMDDEAIIGHRRRALTPDRPQIRGTAQNPDVFFQAKEAVNGFYEDGPEFVQKAMDQFAELTGRAYKLFDYVGAKDAESVVIIMGSGAGAVTETIHWMNANNEKVGMVNIHLFRPFSTKHLLEALPETVKSIVVLDRTKEPGSVGDPLYLDIVTSLHAARQNGITKLDPKIIGGRYGLSSKEFTPAMIRSIFDNLLAEKSINGFTVGIIDDLTNLSLDWDRDFDLEPKEVKRAVFYGLGSDGTVGANKNSIKIIGGETDNYAQGYFVYDSKKSGAVTTSHLRFGPKPITSTYLIKKASFVGVHQWIFVNKFDILHFADNGATLLINSPYSKDEIWDHLPREVQQGIIDKGLNFFVIDAYKVARSVGMGGRINTIMQTCFFAISGVLPREEAIAQIKTAIEKTYGKKGPKVVEKNFEAVDASLANLFEVEAHAKATSTKNRPRGISDLAPEFVQKVTARIMAGEGDLLPVSAFPIDGTWPTGTTKWEKRRVAQEIPIWDESLCTQCSKCAFVCPHAAIRVKAYDSADLENAPEGFKSLDMKGRAFAGKKFTVQVSPDDCTGCTLCVKACPAISKKDPTHRSINMCPILDHVEEENKMWDFFEKIPEMDRTNVKINMKTSQLFQPLFEFSGACAGCGETPYIKLLTQLFGDRMLIANATGCSSIYGGNLPTTPYTTNAAGRGPSWSNSLFEDNAEFGLGMRLAVDQLQKQARTLISNLAEKIGEEKVNAILNAEQASEKGMAEQRARIDVLREELKKIENNEAKSLLEIVDYLTYKTVWIIGGDGWAYDIGYGGLDHVLASGRNVNILVVDTEVYSNTGGQASKATPTGAIAKFAAAGKEPAKKDLGLIAMAYGDVYVAQIAFGANDTQTFRALSEAESYPGVSLVIAYSNCIAHGFDQGNALTQQTLSVKSGHWPLYRFDPRNIEKNKPALKLDSKAPSIELGEYTYNESRYAQLRRSDPERAQMLLDKAQAYAHLQRARLEKLASK